MENNISSEAKKVMRALVNYGTNVQACKFYITKNQIARFSSVDSDFIFPLLRELKAAGCIEFKKDLLYFIRINVEALEKTLPSCCSEEIKVIYDYSVTLLGLSKYSNPKWKIDLINNMRQNTGRSKILAEFAEKNYNKRTPSEQKFSQYLAGRFTDFQEQVPIITRNGNMYILDYLIDQTTCIELDGGYHKERALEDSRRDQDLKEFGIETLRITNEEMQKILNLEEVITPVKVRYNRSC